MRRAALTVTALAFLAGTGLICIQAKPAMAGLFFVPFALGPLCITLFLAILFTDRRAERVLLMSTALYAAWFGYVYVDIFHWHADPQSAIGLLFVGVYALPVLLVFWIVAGRMQHTANRSPAARHP
ncbi:hypothetical protein [Oleiagrimonas soli]|uniref:Transmembrane protein n=1 Tax=Oleiagrimonas soli TaxID=1543381 RepID=A0A099CTK3_9GAMM|nr:hypothetical protein [Oleiagrimonas soli]KGI77089.1 hypothetical protein LF63_0112640 [Oleiagrimonas soli]MBB6185377.1 hypothetical protein [Oleiagrimonas soli]